MKGDVVRGERGAFDEVAQCSWSLPSHYYTDPEICARQTEGIFKRSWACVGHLCDLTEPGSYLTDDIAGQPVLVLRGKDGVLRAFFNVC